MNITEIVQALSAATAEQLAAAITEVDKQAGELAAADLTTENVEKLEALADVREKLAAEQGARQALADRAAAARGKFGVGESVNVQQPAEDGGQTAEGGEPAEDGGSEGDGDGDGGEGGDGDPEGDGDGDGAVTASGRRKVGKVTARKANPGRVQYAGVVTGRATSVANVADFPSGTPLRSEDELADAMLAQFNSINNTRGGGKFFVARVQHEYPAHRFLDSTDSTAVNTAKLNAARDPLAMVAAGGLCAPLETRYDIDVLGVTDRPIRDALVRFGVARGGLTYRPPMNALTMTDGLGVWTVADDEDPEATPKTCAVVECLDTVDAFVYSTYLCLEFPNFSARFDREWVAATQRAAQIAWARYAENLLLQRLLSGSKVLTAPARVSASRDIMVNILKTTAYYRSKFRLNTMVPLRLILPRWVLELMRADLVRGFSGDLEVFDLADATILRWFRNLGVNVTFHLDGLGVTEIDAPPVGAGAENIPVAAQVYANAPAFGPIPDFPNQVDAVLFAEGDWLFLDGGTLDIGLVRDSGLNSRNRYQEFVENWEGVAFNGIESLRLVMTLQPSGATVGTIPPSTTATPLAD